MNTKNCLVILLASVSLSACNSLNFRPTMASDAPLTGYEGRVLQLEMMRPFENASADDHPMSEFCKLVSTTFQESGSERAKRRGASNETSASETSDTCLVYKQDPEPDDVRSYVVSGMAYTDYLCDIFFARIAERSAKREFGRSTANDVGTAVSAILGLANAGSQVTGGIGAGFGLLDSGISNYDQSFTVDADLPALQKLVWSEQTKIRNEILGAEDASTNIPSSYQGAAIQIMRYANTCSFTGMRGLLTESMLAKSAENYEERTNILDFATLTADQRAEVLSVLNAQDEEVENPNETTEGEEAEAAEGGDEAADAEGGDE